MKPTATFKGYFDTGKGYSLPTFIIFGGRLNHSMVTRRTLKKEGIKIPNIPQSGTQRAQIAKGERDRTDL